MTDLTLAQRAWGDVSEHKYAKMVQTHPELWHYIRRLLKWQDIRSLLEIGGGLPHMSQHVEQYLGIEANELACEAAQQAYPGVSMIHADWLDVPTERLGPFDAALAANVVEYVDNPRGFIQKMIDVASRLVIVTFFAGLDRKRNRWRNRKSEMIRQRRHGNRLCAKSFRVWLKKRGFESGKDYDMFQIGTEKLARGRYFREGILVIYKDALPQA